MDIHKLKRIAKGDEPGPGRVEKMIEPFVTEDDNRKLRFRWHEGDA